VADNSSSRLRYWVGEGRAKKKKKKKRSTAETRRDEADWGSEANEREPIKASWSVVVLAQGE